MCLRIFKIWYFMTSVFGKMIWIFIFAWHVKHIYILTQARLLDTHPWNSICFPAEVYSWICLKDSSQAKEIIQTANMQSYTCLEVKKSVEYFCSFFEKCSRQTRYFSSFTEFLLQTASFAILLSKQIPKKCQENICRKFSLRSRK